MADIPLDAPAPAEPSGPALTPRQQETLDRLGAKPAERPTFDRGLKEDLRTLLEEELEGPASALPDGTTLFVNKHALATIHGCEARWHAEDADPAFTVSPPIV